jgi:predicted NBD/HSP70 family sugar kinase
MLASVFNPALILLSGGVMRVANFILPAVRRTVYAETTPLAGRDLRVELSAPDGQFGLTGAALTAIDQLLSAERLGTWPTVSSPGAPAREAARG